MSDTATTLRENTPNEYISDKTLKLFSYLSFMKAPFEFSVLSQRCTGTLVDIDHANNVLIWDIPELMQPLSENLVKADFTKERTRCQLLLPGLKKFNELWTTGMPNNISVISQRNSERYVPKNYNLLTVTLTFNRQNNTRSQVPELVLSGKITNIAEGGCGIVIERRNGIILPGDSIAKIVIKNKSNILLNATGSIIWANQSASQPHLWHFGIKFDSDAEQINSLQYPDEKITRRYLERISLGGGTSSAFIKADHPFKEGYKVSGVVHDISTHGCSFINEDPEIFLPIGTIIKDAMIQLPFSQMRKVTLALRHVSSFTLGSAAEGRIVRKYGFEFLNIDKQFFRAIESIVMEARNTHLKDASADDADALWRFFFETGFIYDEKRRQLASFSDELQETFKKLLSSNSNIMKTVLYKKNGKILAHNTALALYDKTWLTQHLAALKDNGKTTSVSVVMALIDFFIHFYHELGNEVNYVQFYYRPNNPYPALIFGNATELMKSPKKVNLRLCHYYVGKAMELKTAPQLKIAQDRDLHGFEKAIVGKLTQLHIRSEGYLREEVLIPKTKRLYKSIGIKRERFVLVNEKLGYALIEKSGAGLNFSEFTNSVKIFPKALEYTSELTESVSNWLYANSHKLPIVLLLTDEQHSALVSNNFKKKTEYMCWTLDLEASTEFKKAVLSVLDNLKKLKEKKAD